MAALTGHGDPDVQELLPATVSPDRVALVGLHSWTDDDFPNVAEWGIQSFGPDELRATTRPVLDWLEATGCSRVAIHFDVDVIDSDELVLGLGAEPNGLTSTEVRRIVADVDESADVVGFTIAEFIPRQVMHLRQTCGASRSSRDRRLPDRLARVGGRLALRAVGAACDQPGNSGREPGGCLP
ncbi:arginase [Saccharopolyspora erythraea D]|nr:arginase [Saccharopolyspora erythraea D]